MPISELLAELWAIRVFAIDLYLRGCDVAAALDLPMISLEHESLIDRLAGSNRDDNVRRIAEYVLSQKKLAAGLIKKRYGERISPKAFHIPALATFIPELTSADTKTARKGALALNSMVNLAGRLGVEVVEFVMGKRVERCRAKPLRHEHHCDYVHEHNPRQQIQDAVKLLKAEVCPLAKKVHVRLAAEIEPGFSYVLNDMDRVRRYIDSVRTEGVQDLLGLNLDIGHLLIINTSLPGHFRPDDMKARRRHIFHAHCSDNIGYHFRDLVPGTVHDLLGTNDTDFQPWVNVCLQCAKKSSFSGYIAVELEGCSRLQWVQRSLLRLGYLVRTLEQQRRELTKSPGSSAKSQRGPTAMKVKAPKIQELQAVETILILTIRDDELDAMKSAFEKHCGASKAGLQFQPVKGLHEGFLGDKKGKQVRIAVGQIRDTGDEVSAVDTSHYIWKCKELYGSKPRYAMLVGICAGSPKRHAEIGDVVVPPYIFDKSVYKVEWRKDGGQDISNEIRVPGVPDGDLLDLCKGVASMKLWSETIDIKGPKRGRQPVVHDDPVVTASAFLQDGGHYLEECRLSINRKMLAYEMEAGGFANACHRNRIPFLVIRGISDFADQEEIDKTFWPYAARTAATFALAVAQFGVLPG